MRQALIDALQAEARVRYYFRYPLHPGDFAEVRQGGRLLGRAAAKPLYGRTTAGGRVDRSSGFDGRVAVLFLPARARSARAARLLLTRLPRAEVTRPDGKRNWPALRAAAAAAVRRVA